MARGGNGGTGSFFLPLPFLPSFLLPSVIGFSVPALPLAFAPVLGGGGPGVGKANRRQVLVLGLNRAGEDAIERVIVGTRDRVELVVMTPAQPMVSPSRPRPIRSIRSSMISFWSFRTGGRP